MYDALITGIVLADLAATIAGSAALWQKFDHVERRLTIIETEHRLYTSLPGKNPHHQGGGPHD